MFNNIRLHILAVSEDTLNKNLNTMSKQLKQLEIDVKNSQKDKNAAPNDHFVEVMAEFLNTAKVRVVNDSGDFI